MVEFVERPAKRVRVDPEQDLPDISSPLKGKSPRKTKQYGKRGRASSPPQAPDFNDDLDSIPEPPKPVGRPGGVKKATVAGAMKGKTDKKEVKTAAKSKAPEKVKAISMYISSNFFFSSRNTSCLLSSANEDENQTRTSMLLFFFPAGTNLS